MCFVPKDGKMPDNIAYVLCTGSRDETIGNPICSQVCCMYSIKQAQLLMGALPMADVTLYYINIRAFGKGFCEFFQQAKGMGVEFIKRESRFDKGKENGNLIIRYEDILGRSKLKKQSMILLVLSVGVLPNTDFSTMFKNIKVEQDAYNYVNKVDELCCPARTNIDGVFVAGTSTGPLDIPDSILSAGAASAEAAGYLKGGLK